MTNLSARKQSQTVSWLSPERALLVLPLLGGAVLAIVMAMFIVTPFWVAKQARQEEVDRLETQERELTELRHRLEDLNDRQLALESQQVRLLQLVAGDAELATFLSELNDLAVQHRVLIESTKPDALQNSSDPSDAQEESDPVTESDDESAAVQDALFRQGVQRQSASVIVQGRFPDVDAFLRSLEKLQAFVALSDLTVDVVDAAENGVPQTRLSLRLTVYGRAPADETSLSNTSVPES